MVSLARNKFLMYLYQKLFAYCLILELCQYSTRKVGFLSSALDYGIGKKLQTGMWDTTCPL